MVNISNIPYEVFLNFILPLITIKEVGCMAMMDTVWRDMCSDNEVWKALYLRTLKSKVSDTSIHVGRYPPYTTHSVGATTKCITDTKQFGGQYGGSTQYKFGLLRASQCVPEDLLLSLKKWSDVRQDGIHGDHFQQIETGAVWSFNSDCSEYSRYVKGEWAKYNADRGLSTVNLCQCPHHYIFETLEIPNKCRNYKSYKNMTLKKLATKENHDAKRSDRLAATKKQKYLGHKKDTDYLEKVFLKEKKYTEQKKKAYSNICNAIN